MKSKATGLPASWEALTGEIWFCLQVSLALSDLLLRGLLDMPAKRHMPSTACCKALTH